MQRNRARQNPLAALGLTALFVVYEALSMRYLFLPPLFGLLFVLYIRALDSGDSRHFLMVIFMLLVAETAKGYLLFSTVIFFTLSYFLLLPKVRKAVSCTVCLNAMLVAYGYLGYWAFMMLMANMFALEAPHLDWRETFYIAIEFVLAGLL